MADDARQELRVEYREFSQCGFPKLGYRVEGLPEADSVLAGLVSKAIASRRPVAIDRISIVTADLSAGTAKVCQEHQGSREAAELEAYLEMMKRLEGNLRRLASLSNKE